MAASAPARLDAQQKPDHFRFWLGIVLTIVFNGVLVIFTYGKLTQQVDDIHEDLQNVHQDIRDLRHGGHTN